MSNKLMPILFMGHGSPMNAIEDNEFSLAWKELAKSLPQPNAILCISAHWESQGTQVTAMSKPQTIHDFFGFPQELFDLQYPAPGSPQLAKRIEELLRTTGVELNHDWGLDHGTWSVLCRMYPKADIPVVQLSIDRSHDSSFIYEVGKQLFSLRQEGVLVIGSGNLVHNLRMIVWEDTAFDWALEFDAKVKQWILKGDLDALVHYEKQGRAAQLSINSAEHYLPLLYLLGLKREGEPVKFLTEKIWGGSLSMRCVQIG
jgi:4,5-DOPA dioxygenase extradiol